jgi:hypothetical protein
MEIPAGIRHFSSSEILISAFAGDACVLMFIKMAPQNYTEMTESTLL